MRQRVNDRDKETKSATRKPHSLANATNHHPIGFERLPPLLHVTIASLMDNNLGGQQYIGGQQ